MSTIAPDDDARTLHRLGYAQVLYREMGGFSNFAISFTIISILAGCLTSYFIGFNDGGPVAVVWGWLLVGGFVTLVALGMGEVASAMPTAGAIYYWSSKLGSPAWGWFTGWFNLIGQIGVTAAIDYGAAIFWTALMNLWFPSVGTDTHTVFITFSAIMAAHLLLNLNGVRLLGRLNSISARWHMVGVLVIVFVLIIVPDHHQSASFVFGKTLNSSGFVLVRNAADLRGPRGPLLPVRAVLVRVRERPADGEMHVRRLRRVGAHGRGDAQRPPLGGVRRRHVGRDNRKSTRLNSSQMS